MADFINCTKNDIRVKTATGQIVIPKDPNFQLKVDEIDRELGEMNIGSAIISLRAPKKYTGIIGKLPPDGSKIIVSTLLAEHCAEELRRHNYEVFCPDTGTGAWHDNKRELGTYFLIKY